MGYVEGPIVETIRGRTYELPRACRWENGRVVQDPRANRLMVALRDCPQVVPVLMRAAGLAGGAESEATGGQEAAEGISVEAPGARGVAEGLGEQSVPVADPVVSRKSRLAHSDASKRRSLKPAVLDAAADS